MYRQDVNELGLCVHAKPRGFCELMAFNPVAISSMQSHLEEVNHITWFQLIEYGKAVLASHGQSPRWALMYQTARNNEIALVGPRAETEYNLLMRLSKPSPIVNQPEMKPYTGNISCPVAELYKWLSMLRRPEVMRMRKHWFAEPRFVHDARQQLGTDCVNKLIDEAIADGEAALIALEIITTGQNLPEIAAAIGERPPRGDSIAHFPPIVSIKEINNQQQENNRIVSFDEDHNNLRDNGLAKPSDGQAVIEDERTIAVEGNEDSSSQSNAQLQIVHRNSNASIGARIPRVDPSEDEDTHNGEDELSRLCTPTCFVVL